MASRASSRRARAARPAACEPEGFAKNDSAARAASRPAWGSSGVAAAWSRYATVGFYGHAKRCGVPSGFAGHAEDESRARKKSPKRMTAIHTEW
jgi:hypothetical protein